MEQLNTMLYKGYTARIGYDDADGLFVGEVIDLRDVIAFSGESVEELREGFHHAVDDYLAWCEERGEEPEKPYSGNIRLRMTPTLHRKAAVEAARRRESLNQFIVSCIEKEVGQPLGITGYIDPSSQPESTWSSSAHMNFGDFVPLPLKLRELEPGVEIWTSVELKGDFGAIA